MGAIQEEEDMPGRTTPNFSTETNPRPKVEAATPEGATIQSDGQGNIEIHPPPIGNEKTMQLAIICLTLIAVCVVLVDAYTGSGNIGLVVVPIITGITGLLGGQALRK